MIARRQRVQCFTFYGLRSRVRRMTPDQWVACITIPLCIIGLLILP